MKAIILAGGYAKRMWPLTLERPKPLLPIAGRPVIEYIMDKLTSMPAIETIYITVNRKFEPLFREWLASSGHSGDIRLVVEDTLSEKEKLGSMGAMEHIIEKEKIDDDILCVAGDNLFQEDFHGFMDFFRQQGTTVFGLSQLPQTENLSKYGIASTDGSSRVVDFEEKPENPKSDLASTGIYAIPRGELSLIKEYIQTGKSKDTFGHFIAWLHARTPVHGFVFRSRWFDIGSIETYNEANAHLSAESE